VFEDGIVWGEGGMSIGAVHGVRPAVLVVRRGISEGAFRPVTSVNVPGATHANWQTHHSCPASDQKRLAIS